MRFSCRFDDYPVPSAPQLFIRSVTADVFCKDALGAETLVARLEMEHLDLVRAHSCGSPLYACQARSESWEEVFSSLFVVGEDYVELREEFDFEDPINDLLFLQRAVFHRSVLHMRMLILDHAARLFGDLSALVMYHGQTGLPDSDLAKLGFRRIAGHSFLFRPNLLAPSYVAGKGESGIGDFGVAARVTNEVESEWRAKFG